MGNGRVRARPAGQSQRIRVWLFGSGTVSPRSGRLQHRRRFAFAPVDGRRKFKGAILGAEAGKVRLDQDGTEVELDMGNIAKARLVPDYASLFTKREETR